MADPGLEKFGWEAVMNVSNAITGMGQLNDSMLKTMRTAALMDNVAKLTGATWDAASQRFVTAGGKIVSEQGVLNKSMSNVTKGVQSLETAFTTSNTKIASAALNLAKAQFRVQSAGEKVLNLTKQASKEGVNQESILLKVATATRQYAAALGNAEVQQKKFNAVVAAAGAAGGGAGGGFIANLTAGFQNFQNFAGQVGKIIQSVGSVAQPVLGVLSQGVGIVGGAFRALFAPVTGAVQALQRFFAVAAQIAVGVLIRDTIRGIIRELRDLVTAGLSAIALFQNLTLRLENFENRLIRLVDPTKSFDDAMAQASVRASGLVQHIKNLSLIAPIPTEVIANTVSLNLAMGFTERQTIDLTDSILKFTAGMGLTTDVMERIVFNFGQMKAAGKVTGTELRDLARGSFVPINSVLEEAARLEGVAAQGMIEFKKAAAEGRIGIDTFFEAFINVVEHDMPDALQRFSETLQGVQTRIGNFFKTVVGLEILKPIMDRITKAAAKSLNEILTPAVLSSATVLGQSLGRATDFVLAKIQNQFIPAIKNLAASLGIVAPSAHQVAVFLAASFFFIGKLIGKLADVFNNFATNSSKTFTSLAKNAFTWGVNIMLFLARGIIAAATVVVQALTAVARIIASLLSSHSPPKILPKLPEWGAAAFTEFLKGFSEADFDVLTGLQSPIEQALRILVDTGKIAEEDFGKILVSISESIAKVLAGKLPKSQLFAQIEKSLGPLKVIGAEIAKLADLQLSLAQATEIVQAAEARLAAARKAEEAAFASVRSQVRAYNDALRAGADKAILNAKLQQINATESAAQAAQDERLEAETALEVAQEQLAIWKEQVSLQKQLVDQLIKLTEAQIVQPEQPEQPAGGGAGEPPFEAPEPPTFEDVFGTLPSVGVPEFDIDKVLAEAQKKAEEWVQSLEGILAELDVSELLGELGKLATAMDGLLRQLSGEGIGEGRFDAEIAGVTDGAVTLQGIFGALNGTIKTVREGFGAFFDTINTFGFSLGLTNTTIAQFGGVISGLINTPLLILAGIIGGITLAIEAFSTTLENKGNIIQATLLGIAGFFLGFRDGVIKFVQNLKDRLVGNSIIPEMMDKMESIISDKLEAIRKFFEDIWNGMVSFLQSEIVGPITDFVDTTLEKVRAFFANDLTTTIDTFKDNVLGGLHDFVTVDLTDAWNNFKDNVLRPVSDFFTQTIGKTISEFVDGPLTDLKNIITDTLTTALNNFRTNVLGPLETGFNNVKNAIVNAWTWLGNLIAKIASIDLTKLLPFLHKSPAPLALGLDEIVAQVKQLSSALPVLAARLNMVQAPLIGARMSAPALSTGGNSVTMNMANTINQPIDEALFVYHLERAVKRAIR